jgi:parvulin-like peptidyl-prolyl isomerase
VAAKRLNRYKPDSAGLVGDLVSPKPLAGPLNDALNGLEVGQYSSAVKHNDRFYFLYLEKVTDQPGRSLDEVREQIRAILMRDAFTQRIGAYQTKLLAAARFEPTRVEMIDRLVDLAVERYHPAPLAP